MAQEERERISKMKKGKSITSKKEDWMKILNFRMEVLIEDSMDEEGGRDFLEDFSIS